MARFESKVIERIVEIRKNEIPYEFTLDNRWFFEIRYNSYENRFRMILYDRNYPLENEGKGRILGNGEEKFIQDFPLFWVYQEDSEGKRNPNYPSFSLVPRTIDQKEHDLNFADLGEKWFLSYEEGVV